MKRAKMSLGRSLLMGLLFLSLFVSLRDSGILAQLPYDLGAMIIPCHTRAVGGFPNSASHQVHQAAVGVTFLTNKIYYS